MHLGEDKDPLDHVSTVTGREGAYEATVVELGALLLKVIALDALGAAESEAEQAVPPSLQLAGLASACHRRATSA